MGGDRAVGLIGALFFFLLILLCASIVYLGAGSKFWPFNQGRIDQPLPTQLVSTYNGTSTPVISRNPASAGATPGSRTPATGGSTSGANGTAVTQGPTPTMAACAAPGTSEAISSTFANGANTIRQFDSYQLNYAITRTVGSTVNITDSRQVVYQYNGDHERWTFWPPNLAWKRDVVRIGNQVWLGDSTGFTPPIAVSDVRNANVFTDYSAPDLWGAFQDQFTNIRYAGQDMVDTVPAYRFSVISHYKGWITPPMAISGDVWFDACSKVPVKMELNAAGDQSVAVNWRLQQQAITISPP